MDKSNASNMDKSNASNMDKSKASNMDKSNASKMDKLRFATNWQMNFQLGLNKNMDDVYCTADRWWTSHAVRYMNEIIQWIKCDNTQIINYNSWQHELNFILAFHNILLNEYFLWYSDCKNTHGIINTRQLHKSWSEFNSLQGA
jgi:hypothetical protein